MAPRPPAPLHYARCFPRVRGDGPACGASGRARALVSPAYAGMAPSPGRSSGKSKCFPRVRGDGPLPASTRLAAKSFPPRTRGWPRSLRFAPCICTVSPAYAGMAPAHADHHHPDAPFPPRTRGWPVWSAFRKRFMVVSPAYAGMAPSGPGRTAIRACFPRVRGDGPRTARRRQNVAQFPPRTRGWPLSMRGHTGFRDVSPAYAGMAPRRQGAPDARGSFPRVRGDGPLEDRRREGPQGFPPRTRGWPFYGPPSAASLSVSPAYAGMAPAMRIAMLATLCFPRVRGDGPACGWVSRNAATFPPRTRGWPPRLAGAGAVARVSPAYAGMAPGRNTPSRSVVCFPRVRGDGPTPRLESTGSRPFPPRTRGWPPPHCVRVVSCDVSPAYAGMAPQRHRSRCSSRRFPRVRGDGPCSAAVWLSMSMFPPRTRGWPRRSPASWPISSVSPAYAGMAPSRPLRIPWATCFPRVRGDGPVLSGHARRCIPFPPRTRGWPQSAVRLRASSEVSPAYAGMAPPIMARPIAEPCFPRVRGDGPHRPFHRPAAGAFPPRTRGWPLVFVRRVDEQPVSPAYAGMAPQIHHSHLRPRRFPRVRGDGP